MVPGVFVPASEAHGEEEPPVRVSDMLVSCTCFRVVLLPPVVEPSVLVPPLVVAGVEILSVWVPGVVASCMLLLFVGTFVSVTSSFVMMS